MCYLERQRRDMLMIVQKTIERAVNTVIDVVHVVSHGVR